MTSYEDLLNEYEGELDIYEMPMQNKGLYCDGTIWIKENLTSAEKASILAEEIGHHMTSAGDILNQNNIVSMKQEANARAWAQEKMLPFLTLVMAMANGYHRPHELAEYFGVDEAFVRQCLKKYNAW